MSFHGAEFDAACRKLRKEAPLPVPIQVRTVLQVKYEDDDDLDGICRIRYDAAGNICNFKILISRTLALGIAIETLIHEWAHAVDNMQNPTARLHHSVNWGRHFARCYQIVMGRH